MCGIAGFCSNEINQIKNIRKMNDAMRDRGPDGTGYWMDEYTGMTFGHTRLAVLDLSEAGAQPMLSKNQRWVISYNGEIYNFADLRNQLMKECGLVFYSDSDTEVLVEAVAWWGCRETVDKLRGMYAISLYDREKKRLYLIRDCMGEKPIYYGWVNGIFTFASDLKAIRQLDGFGNHLNTKALEQYFKYGYIPSPYSVYEDIYKLKQGMILTMDYPFTEYKLESYWDIDVVAQKMQKEKFAGSPEEAADELEKLLKQSIKDMMVADVPVGVFLSGGTDSSLVTACMQELSESSVNTFTVGFENAAWDEAEAAEKTAEYLGTKHTSIYLTEKDIYEVIPKLSGIYSEPFGDNAQISAYLVSRETKKNVTVVLCGDGGDELFAGYTVYRELMDVWNRLKTGKTLENAGYKSELYSHAKSAAQLKTLYYEYSPQLKELLSEKEALPCAYDKWKDLPDIDEKSLWMLLDQKQYLPDDCLVKTDRAGMAVSLENRIPLLNRDIVEFSWRLPIGWKDDGIISKKILKNVLYRYLPKEMMERPKKGFNIPISAMLRNSRDLWEWAEELLRPEKIRREGILDEAVVSFFWESYKEKKEKWRPVIWYLLMFEEWLK